MKKANPLLTILLIAFFSFSFVQGIDNGIKDKLVLFEGSDWCVNCIRFKNTVLIDDNFIEFLDRNSIDVEHIDFPQRKKQSDSVKNYNAQMAEKYGFEGLFPTILLVKGATDEPITLNYFDQSPEEFIAQIKPHLTQ